MDLLEVYLMTTPLKDKTWPVANIKIRRVVAQTKANGWTKNKTLFWLVDVRYSYGRGIGFRADTPAEVWRGIKKEVGLR